MLWKINDRKRENILIMSIAVQSDPKKLKNVLFADDREYLENTKLDVNALERVKQMMMVKGSGFGVK